MDEKRKPWLFVHSDLDDSDLRPSVFRVLCHVARRADGKTRTCFESIPNMAKGCGLNHKTVRASLAHLVASGWLIRTARPGEQGGDAYKLAPSPPPGSRRHPSQKMGMPKNGSPTNSSAAPLPFLPITPSQKERAKDIHEGNPLKEARPAASDEPTPTVEGELFAEHFSQARKRSTASGTRPHDELFDALARATDGSPNELTRTAARSVGVALAGILKVSPDLTPQEIERRAANYLLQLPNATLTAHALEKHWARCGHPPAQSPSYRSLAAHEPRRAAPVSQRIAI